MSGLAGPHPHQCPGPGPGNQPGPGPDPGPDPGAAGRGKEEAWADYASVFTNAKAGMEGVDKDKVKRIVYEMSKDSDHYKNEQRKQAQVEQRIKKMLAQAQQISPAQRAGHERCAQAGARQATHYESMPLGTKTQYNSIV